MPDDADRSTESHKRHVRGIDHDDSDLAMTSASAANPSSHDNADSLVLRAIAHFERDELEFAIVDLREAVRLNPENARAYRERARVLAHMGLRSEALADIDTAIRLEPEDAEAIIVRGLVYQDLEERRGQALNFNFETRNQN